MGASTVKLTVKDCEVTLPPETVTVALYVPAVSDRTGTTVKLRLPPAAMFARSSADSEKAAAFVPLRAMVSAPVSVAPVLRTVTVCAVCAPYPATCAAKVLLPAGSSNIEGSEANGTGYPLFVPLTIYQVFAPSLLSFSSVKNAADCISGDVLDTVTAG